jgi:hypothetical protein
VSKLIDISGQRFGKLLVIDQIDETGPKRWNCICDCGKEIKVPGTAIRAGKYQSCGCGHKKVGKPREDLTGKRFGRLVVRCHDHYVNEGNGGRNYWLCDCDCGGKKITLSTNLKKGLTKTCGCGRMLDLEIGESGFKELYGSYRRRNEQVYGVPFNISKEEFKTLTSSNCHYCGRPPQHFMQSNSERSKYSYNGLDRVDSDKSYSPENVVPCCGWCNRMKDKHSIEEFKEQIQRLVTNGFLV